MEKNPEKWRTENMDTNDKMTKTKLNTQNLKLSISSQIHRVMVDIN